MTDHHGELPSLRGIVRLGGQTKSTKLNSTQCYDVKFYPYTTPGLDPVFVVCGSSFTIVCRCRLEKDATVEIVRWLANEEEKGPDGRGLNYNSVAWTQADNGDPLVCVTGDSQIRLLHVESGEVVQTLIGHGEDINDLVISPVDPTILASCSIDNSVRIWSLDPQHRQKPLAAICYGQGHRDQVLTLAFHRKGRFILSGGMDTRVNLWVVPDHVKDYAGTDKPAMIHYPHFSTTEVHTDFVDCIQWYNDLILSHACREDKIILWRIDGFNSDRSKIPSPPIPTSSAVSSRQPVTIPANSTSDTRSAWGGRFERLLQFELPHTNQFYIRFSIFHELGRHPILSAGNEKSKVFFWDLQRLEEFKTEDNQGEMVKGVPSGLSRAVRESSLTSNASSASTKKGKQKLTKEQTRNRGLGGGPFRSIKAHKVVEIPKYTHFTFRQMNWSRDGQWCVATGDCGFINVFHRWENGVPPLSTDSEVQPPVRETRPIVDEKKIQRALMEICEGYELRRQIAEEQRHVFDENLSVVLGEYVDSLPEHEQAFARSLEER